MFELSYAGQEVAEAVQQDLAQALGELMLCNTWVEIPFACRDFQQLVDDTLDKLYRTVDAPFSDRSILRLLWDLTQVLDSHYDSVSLAVGDEISGILPAVFIWRLVNKRREEAGRAPAELCFMNGRYHGRVPDGMFPAQESEDERALIITELVGSGDSVKNIARALAGFWSWSSIDVATVGSYKTEIPDTPELSLYYPTQLNNIAVEDILYKTAKYVGRFKDRDDLHSRRVWDRDEIYVTGAYMGAILVSDALYDLLALKRAIGA